MVRNKDKNNVISPIATAVWLIDNTSLTFKQIGDFCNLDEMEVKSMADGLFANNVLPISPISTGCLTDEEIKRCEKNGKPLKNTFDILKGLDIKVAKQRKFVPNLQKKSRPEAILWLITYAKELSDAQITHLVGTTKNMINQIRDKTYKNFEDLVAKDPVIIGFCSQRELEKEKEKARKRIELVQKELEKNIVKK